MKLHGDPAAPNEPASGAKADASTLAAWEAQLREREAALQAAQRRQAFLLDLDNQLRAIEDPLAVMSRAAEMLGLHLKAARTGYGEIDPAQQTVKVEQEWTDRALPDAKGDYPLELFGRAVLDILKEGQALAVSNVATDDRLVPSGREVYESVRTQALVAMPLLRDDGLRAILFVHGCEPREWSADEVALVSDVAERTWSAVERARSESALRKSEERLRLSQEAGGVGVWDWDLVTGEVFWSDKLRDLLGVPRGVPLGGDSFISIIHPDVRDAATADAAAAMRGERPLDLELRIVRPADGREMWIVSRGELVRNAAGEPNRLIGVNLDITERKEAEARIRESAGRLQLAMEASRMGNWTWDPVTDKVILSERAAEIYGAVPGKAVTWTEMQTWLDPADKPAVLSAVQAAAETGERYEVEYRVRRETDGMSVWVAATGRASFGIDGTMVALTGVVQDITDRKRGEDRQHLLIRELHHRVKNTLATVQAIAGSTARTASSIDEFHENFVGRIVSLAQTHNLLTDDLWQKASLEQMLRNELGPYDEDDARVALNGPTVELPSEVAVPVGMAIHELTTNAVKHGALSAPGGKVEVIWEIRGDAEQPIIHVRWEERGGPLVKTPTRQGFGSRLLQRVLTVQVQADVHIDFAETGLRFTMTMPLPRSATLLNLLS